MIDKVHEAEQMALSCIFMDNGWIKETKLFPDAFASDVHNKIFKCMLVLEKEAMPIDPVTFVERFGNENLNKIGGLSYIAMLANCAPTSANFDHWEKLVLVKWQRRVAKDVAFEMTTRIDDSDDGNPISDAITKLVKIEDAHATKKADRVQRLQQLYEDIAKGKRNGVSLGFADLDHLTGGGKPGDFIVLGARPAMGKTAFAVNVAKNTGAKGNCCTIFSLEMSDNAIVTRSISAIGRIDSSKFRDPEKLFDEDDWSRYNGAFGKFMDMPVYVEDLASCTVNDIRSTMRKRVREHPDKKHLCIIDYLQIIKADPTIRSREQQVADISTNIKRMARELEITVIGLAQLSRDVEKRPDKRPVPADLRESGQIEQDADIIGFLYRDEVYNPDTEAKNVVELIIRKHREGPTGTIMLANFKQWSLMENIEAPPVRT